MIETIQNNVLPPVYEQDPVLEIDDFCVEYRAEKTVQAVKHVNLKLVVAKCSAWPANPVAASPRWPTA